MKINLFFFLVILGSFVFWDLEKIPPSLDEHLPVQALNTNSNKGVNPATQR